MAVWNKTRYHRWYLALVANLNFKKICNLELSAMPIAPTHAESEGHQKKNEKNYVTGYQEFFFSWWNFG